MDIAKIEANIELIAAKVHDSWWAEKIKQGFHAPDSCPVAKGKKFEKHCEKCHTDMYPYEELPENIKEYDRVTVISVLNAIKEM